MEVVSFEIAKKLKEKGFREKTLGGYMLPIKLPHFPLTYSLKDWNKADDCYSAPTISQVLKWLRDERNIHIKIAVWTEGWYYEVCEFGKGIPVFQGQSEDYSTYEEAALAGIVYCLDNLI